MSNKRKLKRHDHPQDLMPTPDHPLGAEIGLRVVTNNSALRPGVTQEDVGEFIKARIEPALTPLFEEAEDLFFVVPDTGEVTS
ncbi:hypothetical protein [Kribbella sp.]|uniref:hypothetical protein n=1 Tax=Kribbella sp. TaxID=1871183 RepID=UPI002D749D55|nr:hypothetical protein [Kribbella sp.]HZX07210.1 hypothetical protein [Kribbella sp.]